MLIDYKLDIGALSPAKAHKTDAGFDLRVPMNLDPKDLIVPAGKSLVIDTGVHMHIPCGYTGFLKSKSGLNVKFDLNDEGVIDAGYLGSIVVKVYNHGEHDYQFRPKDKLTQIVILPIPDVELNEVNDFGTTTERGNNGFGSSGR